MEMTPEYLSLAHLAQYSSLSLKTLRRFLSDPVNPLPHLRLLRKILVRRQEFDDWMERFKVLRPGVDLDALVDGVLQDLASELDLDL